MAYDLEEQEQIEALKAWWKKYGSLILWVVIVALAIYTGWVLWGNYQRSQAEQASMLYYELQSAVEARDNEKIQRAATDMQDKFAGTTYATMANFIAARTAYEDRDLDVARTRLQWVIDNGKDDGQKALARIRLAGVLLEEEKYDDALAVLQAEFPDAFSSIVEDRKGDILYAQNKREEARAAYQSALDKASDGDPGKSAIQLKLNDLGGSKADVEKQGE